MIILAPGQIENQLFSLAFALPVSERKKVKVSVYANSTFSFWVGWLVSLRFGLMIKPNPWFKVTEVPKKFLSLNKFVNSSSKFEAKNES